MSEHIEQTISDFEEKLTEQMKSAGETKKLINMLLASLGREPKYQEEEGSGGSSARPLRGDEFVGAKTQHIASKLVLVRRKELNSIPCTVAEIYADLVDGGFEFDTDDIGNRKRGLTQVLSKGSSAFRKLPNGKYGLCEWYGGPKKKKKPAEKTNQLDGSELIVEEDDNGQSETTPTEGS